MSDSHLFQIPELVSHIISSSKYVTLRNKVWPEKCKYDYYCFILFFGNNTITRMVINSFIIIHIILRMSFFYHFIIFWCSHEGNKIDFTFFIKIFLQFLSFITCRELFIIHTVLCSEIENN